MVNGHYHIGVNIYSRVCHNSFKIGLFTVILLKRAQHVSVHHRHTVYAQSFPLACPWPYTVVNILCSHLTLWLYLLPDITDFLQLIGIIEYESIRSKCSKFMYNYGIVCSYEGKPQDMTYSSINMYSEFSVSMTSTTLITQGYNYHNNTFKG